jgi:CBS domain-containing protein
MRIDDMMKHEPAAIGPQATLAEAGNTMATIGCGILPVVDDRQGVVGVITDRDICLALARADLAASQLTVAAAMSAPARTCRVDAEVEAALATLRQHRIRRLPVVDQAGHLAGLFSLDDAALHFADEAPRAAHAALVAETLRAVSSHPLPARR